VLVAVLTACAAAPEPSAEVERAIPMMGTVLTLRVEAASRPEALAASEAAVRALEAAEARLSTWGDGGELARLNRAPAGVPVTLSPELAAELRSAERCRLATGGAFDPGVGALVEAWGLRTGGRRPSRDELAAARAAGGGAHLALGPGDVAVRHHPGLILEEGGFGKGAGLDRAVAAVAAPPGVRRAFLDLGGQVAVLGDGWTVEVADPRRRHRTVLELELETSDGPASVATSGNSERGIEVDGARRSHLLDPRTGEPAEDFGSLTVLVEGAAPAGGTAGGGLWADCLATGLYVLGADAALAWAAARPGVEVLAVETHPEGLRARATPGLAGRLRPRAEELRIEIQGEIVPDSP